jgi:hypothetical protein
MILRRKSRGKRTLGKQRPRWKDHIKINLGGPGCEAAEWIQLTQDDSSGRLFEHGTNSCVTMSREFLTRNMELILMQLLF